MSLVKFFREFTRFSALWRSRHTASQFAGTLSGTVIGYAIWVVLVGNGVDETYAIYVAGSIVSFVSPLISRAIAKATFLKEFVPIEPAGGNWVEVASERIARDPDVVKQLFVLAGDKIGVWHNLLGLYDLDYVRQCGYTYGVRTDGVVIDVRTGNEAGKSRLNPMIRKQVQDYVARILESGKRSVDG